MSKKVLVCDDEHYVLESVSYVVREEGYTAVTAEDGLEALRLARLERPALMIMDVMMPRKSGFEVCQELKSHPETQRIHVILLTGMGQQSDEVKGYASGADDYMTKPFSPRILRQKLREVLGAVP